MRVFSGQTSAQVPETWRGLDRLISSTRGRWHHGHPNGGRRRPQFTDAWERRWPVSRQRECGALFVLRDDFTGSTDVLEALAEAGLRSVLFWDHRLTTIAADYDCQAFGIAGQPQPLTRMDGRASAGDLRAPAVLRRANRALQTLLNVRQLAQVGSSAVLWRSTGFSNSVHAHCGSRGLIYAATDLR